MLLGISNTWHEVADNANTPGHMGIFELGNAAGDVLLVGFAGGRSRYGLRSEIAAALLTQPSAASFRFEVTTAYLTRYQELVMAHQALVAAGGSQSDMPQFSTGHPPGSIRFGRLQPHVSQ